MNRATDTDKAVAHETRRWVASGDWWPNNKRRQYEKNKSS